MFTGIIEETGVVERIEPGDRSIRLVLRARVCARGLQTGDSLAVNGCCLTVVRIERPGRAGGTGGDRRIHFDLLRETWIRTNLQHTTPGARVNLERALAADGRLGGHFVTGHVDGLGRITRWERAGQDHVLEITAPPDVMRYVIFKGSIAVDGISLTVAWAGLRRFRIWIIPHTFEVTALSERGVGDPVNLEADLLGKYVERFVRAGKPGVRAPRSP